MQKRNQSTRGVREDAASRGEGPLPRFGLEGLDGLDERLEPHVPAERGDVGRPDYRWGSSPSLAPFSSDVTDIVRITPRQRRSRAAVLFAALFVPVVLLGLFELATVGRDRVTGAARGVQSWGTALLSGQSHLRVTVPDRDTLLSEDEAREAAAGSLAQSLELAKLACIDPDMQPTTLWVSTSFGEDGRVASIAVEGPTHGYPHVAVCVGEIARHVHIPKFRGAPVLAGREVVFH